MHDKPLFRPRPADTNNIRRNGNTNSTSGEASLPHCKSEDRMLSKSLCDASSPLISKTFLHRHTSDITNITYSGYLLKRSNRPFVENHNTRQSIEGAAAMASTTASGPPPTPFPLLMSPDLNLTTSFAPTFSVLKPKPDYVLDDALSDLDTPNGDTYVAIRPLHEVTPDIDQQQEFQQQDQYPHYEQRHRTFPSQGAQPYNQGEYNEPYNQGEYNEYEIPIAPIKETRQGKSTKAAPPQKSHLELAMDSLTSFFGLNLVDDDGSDEEDNDENNAISAASTPIETTRNIQPRIFERKQSAPIKMGGGSNSTPDIQSDGETRNAFTEKCRGDSFYQSKHRRQSAPILMTMSPDHDDNDNHSHSHSIDSRAPPPADFIDPSDGHIWRAKYCVLEGGILYFYRNPTDGESIEAAAERSKAFSLWDKDNENKSGTSRTRNSSSSANIRDLAKSPMAARPYLHHLDSAASGESGCMWEKRVFLDCVGCVRSAELEYGTNAFELLAVSDEDDQEEKEEDEIVSDKLVLQARNQEEMNEWLFQFHRSIASFLMNLFGSNTTGALDIHHPTFLHQPLIRDAPSEKQQLTLAFASPRLQKHISPLSTSLSHGHGRCGLHRRRAGEGRPRTCSTPISDTGNSSLSSTPDTGGGSAGSLPFAFRDASPSSGVLVPSPVLGSPPRILRPPRPEPAPELSGPQSDYPETERPIPIKAVQGKYIPPMLRNKQGSADGVKKSKYIPPHLRRKQQELEKKEEGIGAGSRYVPPHLRNKNGSTGATEAAEAEKMVPSEGMPSLLSLAERAEKTSSVQSDQDADEKSCPARSVDTAEDGSNAIPDHLDVVGQQSTPFRHGGCADPQFVHGSILDAAYIPRKASKLGKVPTQAFGCFGGVDVDENGRMSKDGEKSNLRWETGAVSECGIRESNEDAYLITSDLIKAFESLPEQSEHLPASTWTENKADHKLGLFAVFDGHCGNQAARFAAEKLAHFVYAETRRLERQSSPLDPSNIEVVLQDAIAKLDYEFCDVCTRDGREWESGSTALVTMLANEHLVIANLGDCRGVLCRSVRGGSNDAACGGWKELKRHIDDWDQGSSPENTNNSYRCCWKEVTNSHSPSRLEERARIELANGWVTTETEIPIGQLRRMDFWDKDVVEILKRCCTSESGEASSAAPQRIMHISRVCGELAVSRALGDRDFKAAFNSPSTTELAEANENQWWDSSLWFLYPENHSKRFQGDLISNYADVQTIRIGEAGMRDEFLLLACDGLWDVMDADDAVRVTRDLLFHKKWTAKKAAARLAELAIHLGSSDNVTVIVVRIFRDDH